MSAHQRYLEAPYVAAAANADAYERWCEENDLDVEGDHFDEFEQAMQDAYDDARISAAEDARDMRDDYDY
jgi:hypothetical protein